MTIAEGLADRIASVTYESLPDDALHWARVAILDTVGVTLAGASEPCAQIAARVLTGGASTGPSLIFGTDHRAAPLDAALINGTASHALDFDDCSNTLGGHPSAPILPALFALAETRDVDGRAFVTAYIAGFETEARISRGINFHHYEKGWHPTATIGVFGAAAACAHLLRLQPDRIAIALGLAASFASGLKANFGTMTKPLHVGHCSRNGLLAALLASEGFTANPGAFEHKQGFLEVFNGAGNYNADAILRDWANPLDIARPGVASTRCWRWYANTMFHPPPLNVWTRGPIRAAWRTPLARTRTARWMPSSACNTVWRGRRWITRSCWRILRTMRIAIQRCAPC